jgi:translocator protein
MLDTLIPDLELLLFSFALSFASMFFGSAASSQTSEKKTYSNVKKPEWAPPGWAFGPVWIAIYTAIAFAIWVVRRDRLYDNLIPQMVLMYILLVLLAVWTWVFFRFGYRNLALIMIIATFGVAVATTALFWIKDWVSGLLLLPLDIWLVIASILNLYAIS